MTAESTMVITARSLARVLVFGLALALAVMGAGWAWERARLGADDRAAVEAIERDTRQIVSRTSGALLQIARSVARQPTFVVAARDDEQAARRLFDLIGGAVLAQGDPEISVTVYGETGVQLAWSGRPDDLVPREQLSGSSALFVAQGALGLRLVAVEPVVDRTVEPPRRLGSVAAERLLSGRPQVGLPGPSEYTLATGGMVVAVRPPHEGSGAPRGTREFSVSGPDGAPLLFGRVSSSGIQEARDRLRRTTRAAAGAVVALALLALLLPIGDSLSRARTPLQYLLRLGSLATVIAAARALFDPAAHALSSRQAFTWHGSMPWLPATLLDTPAGFLLTALAALALVAAGSDASERWRIASRRRRRPLDPIGARLPRFVLVQAVLGTAVLIAELAFQRLLRAGDIRPVFDLLGFVVGRWDQGRVAAAVALLLLHGALFWGFVVVMRFGIAPWRLRRSGLRDSVLLVAAWLTPLAAARAAGQWSAWLGPWLETAVVVAPAAVVAAVVGRFGTRIRRASSGLRVVTFGAAIVAPAMLIYPSLLRVAEDHDRRLVEVQFAEQVRQQREEIQIGLRRSQEQIDRRPGLEVEVLEAAAAASGSPRPTVDLAYSLWSRTDLATQRLASAVEVYGPDGLLFSRFALNLPEYTRDDQRWQEESCEWKPFEEVSPLGPEERQLQHAGRNLCVTEGGVSRVVGTLVVHVMPDFDALPFITSQSPYFELFRGSGFAAPADTPSREVEFVVYGWSRMPIYSSADGGWPLDEALFSRIYASREPLWTRVTRGDRDYHVYFQNDRAGIYALGYAAIGPAGHFTGIAELVGLAASAYVGLLLLLAAGRRMVGGRSAARALVREVRASFYRKLFIAFVFVSVIPVVTLALVTRAFVAPRLRSDVELAAARTTSIAQRVIDEMAASTAFGASAPSTVASYDDDVLIWVSRALNQDVNIFDGPRLVATSQRDLFASGLLSTRTPADVYRAVVLDRRASFVGAEQAGGFQYLLAAAPVGVGERRAVLTVPLMSRQREIEREIAELDRRIIVTALIFVLFGAAIGYMMAERIADPVNRLTRAARRIARGDLDARTALTSADELGRLVEAFNNMAADLQRQRVQLERTNRLEAWAEMARQVAHEIKNPLTPIQLSAEHLRRVHADRGRPLTPVLDECTESILSQVRLLRQIAGEFSSFAASPTPRPVPTAPADLVAEVIAPYRTGLPERIRLTLDVPRELPTVVIDRTLVGRALTNVIDNALHAMPDEGALEIRARREAGVVCVSVIDTGLGLDDEAMKRVFEPYFSTKATGTGLGLAIARRNVELNGGTITLESRRASGTTVTICLPIAPEVGGARTEGPAPAAGPAGTGPGGQ